MVTIILNTTLNNILLVGNNDGHESSSSLFACFIARFVMKVNKNYVNHILGVESALPVPGKEKYFLENTHHKPESDISEAAQHEELLPVEKNIITDPYSTCVAQYGPPFQ